MSEGGEGQRWWLYWLPALAVMAGVFVLSSQSGLRVSEDVQVERPLRVSGHLIAYATLAGLLLFALARRRRPRWYQAAAGFILAVAYGATDELHQSFVPDRTGRVDDLLVDAIGALVGLSIAWLVLSTLARTREEDTREA
jgi:VanZ family protein